VGIHRKPGSTVKRRKIDEKKRHDGLNKRFRQCCEGGGGGYLGGRSLWHSTPPREVTGPIRKDVQSLTKKKIKK